ncbi:hydroxyacid-oxoacid transhydrogenase, mitochondrial-like isoform X1 [Lineus longissimus]|uniref:hydroxyacid-oxoacid transhydrogenase, mitochondrial-like isoform X1 n=1 Tax=Lineus longissimus TaxID=88925 RepID=UPI00315D8065
MAIRSTRETVRGLMRAISATTCRCPAHAQMDPRATPVLKVKSSASDNREYAFEMACSNIRYGEGVTQEVGLDFINMKAKKVALFTDSKLVNLPPVKVAITSLEQNGVNYQLYDKVRVEPTDVSFKSAIEFARAGNFDAYLAVGGGSVMDTCKAANLYATKPDAEFLDFVNAPIGKGLPVEHELKPLIAVPTTSGTGSETTGASVFDYIPIGAKIGIANRAIRPTLGIVDPLHTLHMPERVAAYSGFDVLCHALESYTALPYLDRSPRPTNPKFRPAFQGSNPISDVWSNHALRVVAKYFKRSVSDQSDMEARSQMHLASAFAGIGFGNAGVHLCHGLSYAIAGGVRTYQPDDYTKDHPIIPHGLSVVLTAPSVFKFTGSSCPERHLEGAKILGVDVTNVKLADAGLVLSERMREIMQDMKIEDGLNAVGFTSADIPQLVKGTLPQTRLTALSPRPQLEEDLAMLYETSMKIY